MTGRPWGDTATSPGAPGAPGAGRGGKEPPLEPQRGCGPAMPGLWHHDTDFGFLAVRTHFCYFNNAVYGDLLQQPQEGP